MRDRIVADVMCLLEVFRRIPGIPERGSALETTFHDRYLYDQKVVPEIGNEKSKETPGKVEQMTEENQVENVEKIEQTKESEQMEVKVTESSESELHSETPTDSVSSV